MAADLIHAVPLEPVRPIPAVDELAVLDKLINRLGRSGLTTCRRTPEAILALCLMGRELGVPVMASLAGIHVIQGQPSFSVHLTASLLARGGVRWKEVERSDTRAAVEFTRPGWEPLTAEFAWPEAEKAGLVSKDNWKHYPKAMLWARAFQDGARRIAPDLLAGFGAYTADELGALTDAEGEPTAETPAEPLPEAADAPPEPPTADEQARSSLRERIAKFGELKRAVDGLKAFTAEDEVKWLEWAEGEMAKEVGLDALLRRIQQKIDECQAGVDQTGEAA